MPCFSTLSVRPSVRPPPQFGGKLVSFGNTRGVHPKAVFISQVVTEGALLQRSSSLEASLAARGFLEFCEEKIRDCKEAKELNMWQFLKVGWWMCGRAAGVRVVGWWVGGCVGGLVGVGGCVCVWVWGWVGVGVCVGGGWGVDVGVGGCGYTCVCRCMGNRNYCT